MDLKNKVVVITGASSGIGKELAFQFARKGSKVVLAARTIRALNEVAQKIKSEGGAALVVPTDVSKKLQVDYLAEQAFKEFGRLDIFINNAGVTHPSADLVDLKEADFRTVLETNLMAGVYSVWAAVPYMEKSGGGMLVFVSSVVGKRGTPFNSGYCSSKFAVQGLTESIRPELKKKNIHVLTVCPPGVDTPFFEKNNRGGGKRFRLHPVEKISKMIVKGCEAEKREMWLTMDSKILVLANMMFPKVLDWAIPARKGEK